MKNEENCEKCQYKEKCPLTDGKKQVIQKNGPRNIRCAKNIDKYMEDSLKKVMP